MEYVLTDLLYGLAFMLHQTWVALGLDTSFFSFDLSWLLQVDLYLIILTSLLKWTDGGVAFIIISSHASISFPHRQFLHDILILFLRLHIRFAVSIEVVQCIFNQPHQPGKQTEVDEKILIKLQMQENEKDRGCDGQVELLKRFIEDHQA